MEDSNKIRDIYIPKEDLYKNYGVLDIEGKEINPLNGKTYSSNYYNMNIPKLYNKMLIWKHREEILKTLYENNVILLNFGTGVGKSLLTGALLLHTMGYKGNIALTNPKRIPTQSTATFIAKTLDVKLGEQVGYVYKGSDPNAKSNLTKMLFCTDGYIKARLLGDDPLLNDFDAIVIDEAHERNPNIDLLFLLLRRTLILRPTLKLIIISATIDKNVYMNYFPLKYFKFKISSLEGTTTHPIHKYYLKKPINRFNPNGEVIGQKFLDACVRKACDILLSTTDGDIIVFVTGSSDAKKGCEKLRILLNSLSQNISNETFLLPLYSGIDEIHEKLATDGIYYKTNFNDAKDYDISPLPETSTKLKRKCLFSTEIAESSVTVDGLKYVVDACLSKQSKYYPNENISALEKKYIAKSNQIQRAGRVGRTSEGFYYGIFTENEYEKLRDYPIPPIMSSNASSIILDFMLLEQYISHIEFPITNRKKFINLDVIKNLEKVTLNDFLNELLDMPYSDNIQQSIIRLYYLGVIKITNNKGFLSTLGKFMSKIRIGNIEMRRALISSYNYKCHREVCIIATMVEILDTKYFGTLFTTHDAEEIAKIWKPQYGEFILLLDIFNEFSYREYDQIFYENGKKIKVKKIGSTKSWCKKNKINYNKMTQIYSVFIVNYKSFNNLVHEEINMYLENPNNIQDNFLLYTNQIPILYNDIRLNVIHSLLDGYFLNVIKLQSNLQFTTCFPSFSRGTIDPRQSLYPSLENIDYKYCFYYNYNKTSMNKTFLLINGIPTEVLKNIIVDNDKYDIFKNCLTI